MLPRGFFEWGRAAPAHKGVCCSRGAQAHIQTFSVPCVQVLLSALAFPRPRRAIRSLSLAARPLPVSSAHPQRVRPVRRCALCSCIQSPVRPSWATRKQARSFLTSIAAALAPFTPSSSGLARVSPALRCIVPTAHSQQQPHRLPPCYVFSHSSSTRASSSLSLTHGCETTACETLRL